MKTNGNCVFDTNTLVSALITRNSVSRTAFDKALDQYKILVSEDTVAELHDVLTRDKFRKYISYDDLELFLELLHREARFIEVREHVEASRDPEDDKFLSLAIAGSAIAIVTGDKDLLTLNPYNEICIVTPAEFVTDF